MRKIDFLKSKRGQVTIFIILAVIIVVLIAGFFIFRDNLPFVNKSGEFGEVYTYFDSCVESATIEGLKIAGSGGGYIEVPEFEPGSEYAPFSSQFDFLGNPVPYWYYLSRSGSIKEQVPTKKEIENQLGDYIESNIRTCDFSVMRQRGYDVNVTKPSVSVSINKNTVDVKTNMVLLVSKADKSERKTSHEVEVNSKFGEFYDTALKIYNEEKKQGFLENYSVDVMYNYAPVTDVEISCAPKVWDAKKVSEDIKEGLSANIGQVKLKGDYYSLSKKENNYFVVPVDTQNEVRFLYEPSWPSRIEIWPAENNLLVAEPVGLEEGLGILGFCYVPYHFVYDIYYPTLVQIYDGNELFQFPVAVIIDKSVPRNALSSSEEVPAEIGICEYKNSPISVYTFDSSLNPVEAQIKFQCFNDMCNIGQTEISGNDALLNSNFPSCINGKIIASAEGYVTGEYMISTNEESVANILMDKLYDVDLSVVAGGLDVVDRGGQALVSFQGETYSAYAFYPEQRNIKLAEGFYNVSVQVFSDSSLTIPASTVSNCVDVAKPGILGFLGGTSEQCFETTIPAQSLGSALSAGGESQEFILESDLRGERLKISVSSFPLVNSLEQLQNNYQLIENQNLMLEFG